MYNFAVAKVCYRALSSDAVNVRSFFRLFPVSTTSTDYNISTSYRRGGQNGVEIPLLGLQSGHISSIPCFAAARLDTSAHNLNEQTDPTNLRTIVHDGSGQEVAAYFGCWFDINQSSVPLFPLTPSPADRPFTGRLTIQQLIRNAHQCLVAEIAFDPDPIPGGAGGHGPEFARAYSAVPVERPQGAVVQGRRAPGDECRETRTAASATHRRPGERQRLRV